MNIHNLLKLEFWQQLLSSDFNRGYVAGFGLVIVLLIIWFIIKLIIKLKFHSGRCNSIVVPRADGDLVISSQAVESVAAEVISGYPQLTIRRIRLYRHRKNYSMTLYASFAPDGRLGLPELADQIKPQVSEMLRLTYGIDTVGSIRFLIEDMTDHSLGSTADRA